MSVKPYSVLYIAGYGHSGTTILDLVLGSAEDAFSCGEVTHFTRDGFQGEYCSCHERMEACPFWTAVFRDWLDKSPCSMAEYRRLRNKFSGNMQFGRVLLNRVRPSSDWKVYVRATELFYDEIHHHSGKSVLVDSSKEAGRVLMLSQFALVTMVHVCRNFRGVLNSEKKIVEVDLEKGIEEASPPKRGQKVVRDWLMSNAFCSFARWWMGGHKLVFSEWLRKPGMLSQIQPSLAPDVHDLFFKAEHMMAGNAIRMKPPQKLRVPERFTYPLLSERQHKLAAWMERLFFFWGGNGEAGLGG